MKKLLPLFIILTIYTMDARAQANDTTRNKVIKQEDNTIVTQPSPDLIKLEHEQLPESLLKILQKRKYKGWEHSMIYKQKSTNEYILEILDGKKSTTYRFDENGNPIKK